MSKILGIDLGTSNTAAAIMEGGKATIIPSAEGTSIGGKAFPSYVAFAKDGQLLVGESIARYRKLQEDPVAQGLLVLMGSTDRIIHSFKVKDGIAFGYDEKGDEIVSVPVTEPMIDRTAYDQNLGAIRNNTP
jgi:molecular chaperone DnaK (HSP70)